MLKKASLIFFDQSLLVGFGINNFFSTSQKRQISFPKKKKNTF